MSQSPEQPPNISAQPGSVIAVLRDRLSQESMERAVAEAAYRERTSEIDQAKTVLRDFLTRYDEAEDVETPLTLLRQWVNPTPRDEATT